MLLEKDEKVRMKIMSQRQGNDQDIKKKLKK